MTQTNMNGLHERMDSTKDVDSGNQHKFATLNMKMEQQQYNIYIYTVEPHY